MGHKVFKTKNIKPNCPEATTFLVFSDDWGEHPSSSQHIFRHISKKYLVLWVNTIGMRRPKATRTDLKKISLKIKKMLQPIKYGSIPEKNCELTVCQPLMLPYSGIKLVRKINRFTVVTYVRRALNVAGIDSPILVSTVPNACDYIGHLGEKSVIYYCVDDFSEWPGMEKEVVTGMERKHIKKSDSYVATSKKLFDKLSKYGKPTYLLNHGVDLDFFSFETKFEHECLREIPKPRLGYFGLFDERSDQDLIIKVASRLKDYSFVITGPVVVDIKKVTKLKNVFFTGKIPYLELPSVVKGFDILFIPYVNSKLTESISPLKFKEYLATGKPIVSTPIAEMTATGNLVSLAATAIEWEEAIRKCTISDSRARHRRLRNVLAGEQWSVKAEEFLQICRKSVK